MSEPSKPDETQKEGETENKKEVHSANSWETADLGDEERNKKFLRLMGASKTEHRGKFVIGDKEPANVHARAKIETEEVNHKLEEQFRHSHEHRITKWSHKGLGFEDEKPPENTEEKDSNTGSNKQETATEDQDKVKQGETGQDRKRESSDTSGDNTSPPKKPKMMMNFVKSSD